MRLALPAFSIRLARLCPEGLLLRFADPGAASALVGRLGGILRPQEAGELIVAPPKGEAWTASGIFARLVQAVSDAPRPDAASPERP